jgi:hypothetical protein
MRDTADRSRTLQEGGKLAGGTSRVKPA